MGQKPGLDGLETTRDITDRHWGAGRGWLEKGQTSVHQRMLMTPTLGVFSCLSMVTNFTCKHWWSFGD